MGVIHIAADDQGGAALVTEDPAHINIELGFDIFSDEWPAVFRTEDEVDMDRR